MIMALATAPQDDIGFAEATPKNNRFSDRFQGIGCLSATYSAER